MDYLDIKKDFEKKQDQLIKELLKNKDIIIKTSKEGLKIQTLKLETLKNK